MGKTQWEKEKHCNDPLCRYVSITPIGNSGTLTEKAADIILKAANAYDELVALAREVDEADVMALHPDDAKTRSVNLRIAADRARALLAKLEAK
jgi:hypothetical protein